MPTGVTTRNHAVVTNGAGYAKESVTLLGGAWSLERGAGRRVPIRRRGQGPYLVPIVQPKANLSFRPSLSLPFTLYANYRGISTADARGVVQHREQPAVSTTDFYQVGSAQTFGRLSTSCGRLLDRPLQRAGLHSR